MEVYDFDAIMDKLAEEGGHLPSADSTASLPSLQSTSTASTASSSAIKQSHMQAFGEDDRLVKHPKPSAAVAAPSDDQHAETRLSIVRKLMSSLAVQDIHQVFRLVREHCDDQVMFITPAIKDPIFGKTDLMVIFSLFMEAFPDGVATVNSIEVLEEKVSSNFSFQGTKVFPTPMNTVFKHVRTNLHHQSYDEGDSALASMQLVQDISESVPPPPPPPVAAAVAAEASSVDAYKNGLERYLRSLPMENTVLRDGQVSFQRDMNFYFDEQDHIIHITSFNTDGSVSNF